MSFKTIRELDEYVKETTVVYNHSNAKLVSRKAKPSRNQAFQSVLHFKKPSSRYHCTENEPTRSPTIVQQTGRKSEKESASTVEQKVQIFVRSTVFNTPKTLCLQLDPKTSILSLKEFIKGKIGIEPRYQLLYIRRNVQLLDWLTIHDHGIEKDENISLRLSSDGLLGGGPEERRQTDGEFLWNVSSRIGKGWARLARILGFEETEMEEFESEHRSQIRDQCLVMLVTWWMKQETPEEARRGLREALTLTGCGDLVSKVPVEQSYQIRMMTSPEKQRLGQKKIDDRDKKQVAEVSGQSSKQGMTASPEQQRRGQEQVGVPNTSKADAEQVTGFRQQSSHQVTITSPEQQRLELEEVGDQHTPRPEKLRAGGVSEQICEAEATRSHEKQRLGQDQIGDVAQPPTEQHFDMSEVPSTSQDRQRHKRTQEPEEREPVSEVMTSSKRQRLEQVDSVKRHTEKQIPSVAQAGAVGNGQQASGDIVNIGSITIHNPIGPVSVGTVRQEEVRRHSSTNAQLVQRKGCSPVTSKPDASQDQYAAADLCEEALKTRYMTTGSYVQMLPWVDDDKMHIMDIYTKLQLEKDDDEIEGEVELYEDVFHIVTRDGKTIKRVICNGSAGLGKSTLIDKIAYDWAVVSIIILKRYKLVFVLKMHALKQDSDLIDAIFNQLLDEDTRVDRNSLQSFIDTNPDKVLILLDGFDEFMTTNLDKTRFGSLLKILNRKIGRDLFVVISTRPSHFAKLVGKSLVEKPFTHVKVLGFDEYDIQNYVERFYKEETIKAQGLIERIQFSDVLSDLAKSPMLLLLMCLLWRADSALPDTMSQLYDNTITYIFKRKGIIATDEISSVVNAIGRIALDGLLSPEMRLSFKESDFEKNVLDTAIKAGILTSQRVFKGIDSRNSVYFIHKTFQEFSAAKYHQSLSREDTGDFQSFLDQIDNPLDFEYLLRFCCGDNDTCTSNILRMLQRKMQTIWGPQIESLDEASDDAPEGKKYKATKLALSCYFESQSKETPTTEFITSVLTDGIEIRSVDHLNSFVYFLKNITVQRNAHLSNVHALTIDDCNMRRFHEDLVLLFSEFSNLSVLKWTDCSLTGADVVRIVSSFRKTPNLTELDLSRNADLGSSSEQLGSEAPWALELQHFKHLRKLTLNDCELNRHDAKCLAAFIGCNENLSECWVDMSEGWLHVEPVTTGIELSLFKTPFTGTDLADIIQSLSHRNDLRAVTIADMDSLSGSTDKWCRHLKQLEQLERFHISNCSLQCSEIVQIVSSLIHSVAMVNLNLSHNKSLGGRATSWVLLLKEMKQLKVLNLYACSLTVDDVKHIALSLGNKSNLKDLYLSGNQTLGGLAHLWALHLKEFRYLCELNLGSCTLTVEDLKHIAMALSNMPILVKLVLCYNEAFDGMGASWSVLKEMKHVQRVSLAGCSLQIEDVQHIAVAFSDMPNLVELDLSENYDLGNDNSPLWAPYLKKMQHLQKLNLRGCLLTDEDKKLIVESQSNMKNMLELDMAEHHEILE